MEDIVVTKNYGGLSISLAVEETSYYYWNANPTNLWTTEDLLNSYSTFSCRSSFYLNYRALKNSSFWLINFIIVIFV